MKVYSLMQIGEMSKPGFLLGLLEHDICIASVYLLYMDLGSNCDMVVLVQSYVLPQRHVMSA